jgi:hypothetical protein
VTERLRAQQMNDGQPRGELGHLFARRGVGSGNPSPKEMLGIVQQMYEGLPDELKSANPMTGDIRHDRYGFQGMCRITFVRGTGGKADNCGSS